MNKAFVINLDHCQERFEEVRHAFSPYGISCERFAAIKHEHGFVGCALSHLELIARAKKEEWPWIMVFEDDCVPRDAMKEWPSLQKILKRKADCWDVFLGGTTYLQPIQWQNMHSYSTEDRDQLRRGSCHSREGGNRSFMDDLSTQQLCANASCCSSSSASMNTGLQENAVERVALIQCCDVCATHFAIYHQTSYEVLLAWHELPMQPEERVPIDIFIQQSSLRTWVPSPFMAWQKPRYSDIRNKMVDYDTEFKKAEHYLDYFRLLSALSLNK